MAQPTFSSMKRRALRCPGAGSPSSYHVAPASVVLQKTSELPVQPARKPTRWFTRWMAETLMDEGAGFVGSADGEAVEPDAVALGIGETLADAVPCAVLADGVGSASPLGAHDARTTTRPKAMRRRTGASI